jgi:hypothetical protein
VTSAAFALSPSPSPSTAPAASAITFFAAAAELDADDVVVDVDAEDERAQPFLQRVRELGVSLAITDTAGSPASTSSAMFGPRDGDGPVAGRASTAARPSPGRAPS